MGGLWLLRNHFINTDSHWNNMGHVDVVEGEKEMTAMRYFFMVDTKMGEA